MNGLDQIIGRIQSESQAECDEILKKAQTECENIKNESNQKADALVSEIRAAADLEISQILEMYRQRSETDGKKKMLNSQQALVSKAVNEAAEKLENLPDSEYFNLLTKLLGRYAQKRSGEILLRKSDVKRMTDDFKKETDRHSLTVTSLETSEDEKINGGGFVLRYGEIEENCMFSALFADKRDIIHDKVYQILFG